MCIGSNYLSIKYYITSRPYSTLCFTDDNRMNKLNNKLMQSNQMDNLHKLLVLLN